MRRIRQLLSVVALWLTLFAFPVTASPALTVWPNAVSRANSDPWLASHHDQIKLLRPRLLVLNFSNGLTPQQAQTQVRRLMAALRESSRYHGYKNAAATPALDYQLFRLVDLTDTDVSKSGPDGNSSKYPRNPAWAEGNGEPNFRYADLFSAKYAAYYGVSDRKSSGCLTLGQMVDRGLVNEVWFLAIQGKYGSPAETTELKQVYDARFRKVPGKFVQAGNAGDHCDWPWTGRSLRILFMNSTRGPGCAMESLGHSMEATANSGAVPWFTRNFDDYAGFNLDKRFGLPFDRLYGHSPYSYPNQTTLVYQQEGKPVAVKNYVVTGGNVHFCPTARQDYDLDSPFTVLSTIEHYGLRDGPGGRDQAEPWTVAKFQQYKQIANDCQGPWLVYWRQNMPGFHSPAKDLDGRPMKDWWPFLFY